MSESGSENVLSEVDEGTLIHNSDLLRIAYTKDRTREESDRRNHPELFALENRGVWFENGKPTTSIRITYNTHTGRIELPNEPYEVGDYSRISTDLVELPDGSLNIRLHYPGEGPTPAQLTEIVRGNPVENHGVRFIQPERIIPGQEKLQGIFEPAGSSQFTTDTRGDKLVIRSIQQFNQRFHQTIDTSPSV